jgi:hypothetical protein
LPVNPNPDSKRIDEKDVSPSSKYVASVASVADLHKTGAATTSVNGKGTEGEINSPLLPCLWCDYKNRIEFDLGNHLLANHRDDLLRLSIGKGPMDNRIDYAVQLAKRMMAEQYDDDEDDVQENDSNDIK